MAIGAPESNGDDLESVGGIFSDINITPLTDIFLVLLIIFMVTTTAIAEAGNQDGGFKVNLPRGGKTDDAGLVRDVTVAILADGRAVVAGKVLDEDARAQCDRSGSAAAEVFLAALVASAPRPGPRASPTPERVVAAVERERLQANLKLRRNLWILGTVGATAPFIGLFGTVVGIMHAFRQMAMSGQGGFAIVAAGISEALVTTAGGIAVAIEAVVIYNFLNVHVGKLALQLKLLTEEFLEILRDALPGAAPAAAPPRATGEG